MEIVFLLRCIAAIVAMVCTAIGMQRFDKIVCDRLHKENNILFRVAFWILLCIAALFLIEFGFMYIFPFDIAWTMMR